MKVTAASDRARLIRRLVLVFSSTVPCVIAFGWSALPLSAVWVAVGGARILYRDQRIVQDSLLFGTLSTLVLNGRLFETVKKKWGLLANGEETGYLAIAAGAAAALATFGYLLGRRDHSDKQNERKSLDCRPYSPKHPSSFIIPCRTTHTRMFPKKHSFGYNYLLCGFPIVPSGVSPEGTEEIHVNDKILGKWWLRVKAGDYLVRGQHDAGFYGKLKLFLREKGVEDNEWSYAYLVTAPRFFGYSFNPASFWYIYDQDHQLTRMIVEVNNTFGERRLYLLDGSVPMSPPRSSQSEDSSPERPSKPFSDMWTKDFHVSPFNSRKGGGYTLKSSNPFPTLDSFPIVDINITLKSTKDHPKLIARLFSVAKAWNVEQMSWFETASFLASWGWVGFMTFPRIIKEAFSLYFRKGLHVWFRPEVLPSSIGRLPTETECFLQMVFKKYLLCLVHLSHDPFWITYDTAIPDTPKDIIATTHERGRTATVKNFDICVNSGAFYSRFVHYAHTSEAFDRECLFTDEKNRTLSISQPDLLPLLLLRTSAQRIEEEEKEVRRSYLDELRWMFLRRLRCAPAEPAYPISPKSAEVDIDDIRSLPFSELDRFVRGPGGMSFAGAYRRATTKIFLAQRYALGFVEIIDLLDLCIRAGLCWLGVASFTSYAQSIVLLTKTSWTSSVWMTALSLSACHVYGILKGYK